MIFNAALNTLQSSLKVFRSYLIHLEMASCLDITAKEVTENGQNLKGFEKWGRDVAIKAADRETASPRY